MSTLLSNLVQLHLSPAHAMEEKQAVQMTGIPTIAFGVVPFRTLVMTIVLGGWLILVQASSIQFRPSQSTIGGIIMPRGGIFGTQMFRFWMRISMSFHLKI